MPRLGLRQPSHAGPAREAGVKVVVVSRQALHDASRPGEPDVRADEDARRPGRDEAIDEILGESAVDLRGPLR